jgi:hypothetical protein
MSGVKRTVPPPTVIRMVNPLVRALLQSPMHGLADQSVVVLHLTGRRTGRRYSVPINYVMVDGRIVLVTIARWRVNLRGGADVELTWHGHRRPMRAWLEEDPAAVAVAYQSLINHLGWPAAGRRLGISTEADRKPTAVELRDAAAEYGWSVVTLTPR